jgi:cytidylate kinase
MIPIDVEPKSDRALKEKQWQSTWDRFSIGLNAHDVRSMYLASSIIARQVVTHGFYRKTYRELKENFPPEKLQKEFLSFVVINYLAEFWDRTNKQQLPSLILDGPVRSGTSTQAEMWKKYFDFETLQMGMMFRSIAYIAIQNNLTSEQVIEMTKAGQFYFSIRFQDDQPIFEIACTHPHYQFVQTVEKTQFEMLRTNEINAFAAALNNDSERAVEKMVVGIVNAYLEKTDGVVMEGRNLASIIPSYSLRAFYLAVSDDEARAREIAAANRARKKAGQPPLTLEEAQVAGEGVVTRNTNDMENGILLAPGEAFRSEKYTAIYETDKALPNELFLSMVQVHDLIQLTDLFIPTITQAIRLRLFTGYSDNPEKTLLHFSRRKERPEGNRALA